VLSRQANLMPGLLLRPQRHLLAPHGTTHSTVTSNSVLRTISGVFKLVVRRSGNAFDPINEVTVRWARLVLGWVTACGQENHLGM